MKKITSLLLLFCVVAFAQQKGTFKDSRDGKTYKTVKIDDRIWMAQNLDYRGEDGFLGLCYGDKPKENIRMPENCKKYGRLYNWDEAMEACPEGWYLPSEEEWKVLVDFAGGWEVAGRKLKAKNGWTTHDFSGTNPKNPECKWKKESRDDRGRVITAAEYNDCVSDEYGFSALPGGSDGMDAYYTYRLRDKNYGGGKASNWNYGIGNNGNWWSSTMLNRTNAYCQRMYHNSSKVVSINSKKLDLFSVRCILVPDVKIEAADPAKDSRDGKEYKAVKIGTQIWMAENLDYDAKGSKCYNNNPYNCTMYGRLYNWSTARLACPSGWHLPSKNEWVKLIANVGGKQTAGTKLKATKGWNSGSSNGTDNYDFSALPGGVGDSRGDFASIGDLGSWWSDGCEQGCQGAYGVFVSDERITYNYLEHSLLFSIRCLRD